MSAERAVLALARPEIRTLSPYEHAAWAPGLERLHANELPWRVSADDSAAGLNRYPEPQPRVLLERLARLYGVEPARVLVGRGSDEGIDLLVRAFCRCGADRILICPPTFGMYAVAARIQGAEVVRVSLDPARGFALDAAAIDAAVQPGVKLVFICSPNNPTGNRFEREALLALARTLEGRALLIIDEAYAEFAQPGAGEMSLASELPAHPNLVLLRTLSKAYGLAGARCGVVLGAPELIALLRKIIPPYALAQQTLETVLAATEPPELAAAAARIALLRDERARLAAALARCPAVLRVWPSEANFLLVEFDHPGCVFDALKAAGLLVRDLRAAAPLARALRISVGTPEQNARLLATVRGCTALSAASGANGP